MQTRHPLPRFLLPAVPVLVLALAGPALLAQQPAPPAGPAADSLPVYAVHLRDGGTVVGRVEDRDADPLVVVTPHGTLRIPRADVRELTALVRAPGHRGEYWPPNPNETRLFFAPTGRMLRRGEGYFSNTYLFFQQLAGGVTDRVTLGGGMSLFPSDDITQNVFYLTPKVGVYDRGRTSVAVGALAGVVPVDDGVHFGIAYGVATFGSPDGHVTVGTGLGYDDDGFADHPIAMLGGEMRVSRRTSLLSENYLFPASLGDGALVSYGMRFFGEKLSVDLAFWNFLGGDSDTVFFPGIPYVAFSFKW